MKLLIVIPAYNEAENLERFVEELKTTVPGVDFVVVNDGSRDETAAICRRNGYPLLDLPANLGLTGAFKTGIRYACEQGYDAAMQMDGDGQHEPRFIPAMAEAMEREVLEKPFVGEMGAALLGPYGESDHLVIRRPKKEVRLHYLAPQRKIDRTGDFDIIFAEKKLEKDFTSGKDNLYYYYMGSNDQLGSIENPDGGDSELLLIKDSFACVVMPFLALTAGKVTWWDMREDTAVFEYIREHPEIRTVILRQQTHSQQRL